MELRQLEYFVAVAEESSFTKGAARVHVAQPGVSAQIRRLERELGQPLFDRSERTVRLTSVGAAVLPRARAALAAVGTVQSTVDDFTGLIRGHVTVGTVSSTTSGDVDLPELLADFHREHPGIAIALAEDKAAGLIDALLAGRIDVAFVAVGADDPIGLGTATVRNEVLVAAVALDDPLADAATITLAELVERALITLPRGSGIRAILDDACAAAGLTPKVAFEASNPLVVAQLAAGGLGVAVVPGTAVEDDPNVHVLELIEPCMTGRIVLAWRTGADTSPAARAFLARARLAHS
ncbi:LysR family transcriptional regulator [Antrihabitans cavernicola]|uniref:LysR family transcriptional regulator n=1 Tax=Antrihabitans cavernicola TaxID=2495913 RepID=A0A5A7S6E6_9NOCA|nr:LysR family transcriptional regulator [Spelaeibacter cavernicola]KAA0021718.1 LysR family transcriptional regulator [Spelaeibacter cavernicola]